jgi:predicted glycosyltransferase
VNRYLVQKGFPYVATTEEDVFRYAQAYLGKRFDVADKLGALENPVDVIEKVVNSIKPR